MLGTGFAGVLVERWDILLTFETKNVCGAFSSGGGVFGSWGFFYYAYLRLLACWGAVLLSGVLSSGGKKIGSGLCEAWVMRNWRRSGEER